MNKMGQNGNVDAMAAKYGIDLSVNIAGVTLKNPITTASGTFSPRESSEFYDLSELGAMITKGVASVPWDGNPVPRIAETYGGMINAVGLQNPGVDYYIEHEIPFARQFDTKIIANVAGHSIPEYCDVVERLSETDVDMLEVNISCPNVKEGGIGFGTSPAMAAEVTRAVKRVSKKPIIVKLSPNVTDITEIAKAVEAEGADAVSLINTLIGMRIDVHRKRPVIANKMGGFSGPAIKPVAVRMVYQVRRAVNIPIIGLGGIMTGEDNDFNKVPNGLIQPLIIEDTHIQCLVPVMQGDEPNAGAVFHAFVGDEGDTHAVGDQIQCGPGGIHSANHCFVGWSAGSPFFEAAAYIIIKYNLRFSNHILGIDKIPVGKRMGQGNGNKEISFVQFAEVEAAISIGGVYDRHVQFLLSNHVHQLLRRGFSHVEADAAVVTAILYHLPG